MNCLKIISGSEAPVHQYKNLTSFTNGVIFHGPVRCKAFTPLFLKCDRPDDGLTNEPKLVTPSLIDFCAQ